MSEIVPINAIQLWFTTRM